MGTLRLRLGPSSSYGKIMEEEGFSAYTLARHEEVIQMLWLLFGCHFIHLYILWNIPRRLRNLEQKYCLVLKGL